MYKYNKTYYPTLYALYIQIQINKTITNRKYDKALKDTFASMKSVENVALIVQANASKTETSNCKLLADKITENKASILEKKVLEAAQKAFKFLFISRRGFYCALCDQESHEFINIYSSSIVSSNQFCRSLVENTLNFYIFKFNYFMKLSRLYALFLITCDFKGRYDKSKFIAYQSKFFKEPKVLKGLDNCKNKIGEPHGYKYCLEYCSNFNPARYSEVFEGDIDRMEGYSEYLKNNMEIKQIQYERESAKDVLNMKGRLLEALITRKFDMDGIRERQLEKKNKEIEEKEKKEKKADDGNKKDKKGDGDKKDKKGDEKKTPAETVNTLNKELRSAILKPINYSFEDDKTIAHTLTYKKSIFHQGFYKTFRIHKYGSFFDAEGINWHGYGLGAKLNKEGLKEVMEMVPPNDIQVRELFFEVMKE